MIALDVRETTVAEAIENNVDLIIVKHAPIFRPLKIWWQLLKINLSGFG